MSLNAGASSFAPPMPPMPRARASVKHLTCYYWATGKCRHPEDQCLYSHKHTGRMANKPVKLEHDKPAVAGRNALSSRPVHYNWRGQFNEQEAVQRKIDNILQEAEQKRGQGELFGDTYTTLDGLVVAMDTYQSDIGQSSRRLADIYYQMKEEGKEVPFELIQETNTILRAHERHEKVNQQLKEALAIIGSRKVHVGWGHIGGGRGGPSRQ